MQSNKAGVVCALLVLLAQCQCVGGAKSFLSHLAPSGDADVDARDAAAIKKVERLAVEEERDSEAVAGIAQSQEGVAKAEEESGSEAADDAAAVKKAALLEYTERLLHAKKELVHSPKERAVAEHAASLQEHTEFQDSMALEETAASLKRDAVAVREEEAEEISDSKAIAKAANLTLMQEEADVKALEEAARRERAGAGSAKAFVVQQKRKTSVQEAESDANQLRGTALQEEQAAKGEWNEADDERRDADALKRVAMFGYLGRIQQAKRQLADEPEREQAAEADAQRRERRELADAHSIAEAADALRKDAEATSTDSEEVSEDASAIEAAAHLPELKHK